MSAVSSLDISRGNLGADLADERLLGEFDANDRALGGRSVSAWANYIGMELVIDESSRTDKYGLEYKGPVL